MRRGFLWFGIAVAGCGRIDFASRPVDCAVAAPGEPCFTMILGSVTWDEASAACAQLGPSTLLATIANADDSATAEGLATTIPFAAGDTNTNQRQRMWIGASDRATPGTWTWASGAPVLYFNWRAGEPDTTTEHCMIVLGSEGGQWDNRPCDLRYDAYLCERDP